MSESDEAILRITREFAGGLPRRVEHLRCALDGLARGYDTDDADQFYLQAHSLSGTAAAYRADEVASVAQSLSGIGRRWRERRMVTAEERVEAERELGRLGSAVDAFRGRFEASGEPPK